LKITIVAFAAALRTSEMERMRIHIALPFRASDKDRDYLWPIDHEL